MLIIHNVIYQVIGVLQYKTQRVLKRPVPMDSSENVCPALKYQERSQRQGRQEADRETICAQWQDCETKEPKGYDLSAETRKSTVRFKIRRLSKRGKCKLEDRGRSFSECDACISRHSDASPTCSRALRLPTITAINPQQPLIDMVTRLPVGGWSLNGDIDLATKTAELNFRVP